ncbi:farnesyl pyrophosphate synthase-like isoform X2 [Hyperolius riggenbachi]
MSSTQVSAEHQEFHNFFKTIVQDLTVEYWDDPEIGDAISRLKEVLEYHTPGGKCIRGVTVLASFQELAGPELQTDEYIQRVLAVGWCIELLYAFFLMADDIMDHSETRRGKICWYKKDGIGLSAVNDACLIEACAYQILKKYCRGQPYYLKLLELFLESSYQMELGQVLDLTTTEPGRVDLEKFTETRCQAIVNHKVGVYSFYLPVAAALYLVGIDDEQVHRKTKTILLEMGEFHQIENDYLDCFGDPGGAGKFGSDIEENKCSWLVTEALKRATPEQRRILEENYGQNDVEKMQLVKQLYEELDLPSIFRQYEEESYQRLQTLISQHAHGLPKEIFLSLARKIYKRHI